MSRSGAEIARLKAGWRSEMMQRRRALPSQVRCEAGVAIAHLLQRWERLPRSGLVATFIALAEELPTELINSTLRKAGLQLVVPAFDHNAREYRFARWDVDEALVPGPMKVPEPVHKRWCDHTLIDLFIVPGLAFDRSGGRIGYGGGHYDRLLARRAPTALAVAIGYPWQLVEKLPQDRYDTPLDWVVTPDGFNFVGTKGALERG